MYPFVISYVVDGEIRGELIEAPCVDSCAEMIEANTPGAVLLGICRVDVLPSLVFGVCSAFVQTEDLPE